MIYTYRELKKALSKLDDKQLDQQVQVMLPQFDCDKSIPLHCAIGFNTVHYFISPLDSDEEQSVTRSSVDNKHHPEHFILLVDYNMYAEDGTIGFDLLTGEREKVKLKNEFNETVSDAAKH